MAKRGRKPTVNNYFGEKEENTVIEYINCKDEEKKNEMFREVLLPAITIMIESIIRRYKLYVPNEDFDMTFNDTISYLLTKINYYDPNKQSKKNSGNKCRAFSYLQTICKNYLIGKNQKLVKDNKKMLLYSDTYNDSYEPQTPVLNTESNGIAEVMVKKMSREINDMLENHERYKLTKDEMTVGIALVDLLNNWENVLPMGDESKKLQKSNILYFLREETMMTTADVRKNMKKYKNLYMMAKEIEIQK